MKIEFQTCKFYLGNSFPFIKKQTKDPLDGLVQPHFQRMSMNANDSDLKKKRFTKLRAFFQKILRIITNLFKKKKKDDNPDPKSGKKDQRNSKIPPAPKPPKAPQPPPPPVVNRQQPNKNLNNDALQQARERLNKSQTQQQPPKDPIKLDNTPAGNKKDFKAGLAAMLGNAKPKPQPKTAAAAQSKIAPQPETKNQAQQQSDSSAINPPPAQTFPKAVPIQVKAKPKPKPNPTRVPAAKPPIPIDGTQPKPAPKTNENRQSIGNKWLEKQQIQNKAPQGQSKPLPKRIQVSDEQAASIIKGFSPKKPPQPATIPNDPPPVRRNLAEEFDATENKSKDPSEPYDDHLLDLSPGNSNTQTSSDPGKDAEGTKEKDWNDDFAEGSPNSTMLNSSPELREQIKVAENEEKQRAKDDSAIESPRKFESPKKLDHMNKGRPKKPPTHRGTVGKHATLRSPKKEEFEAVLKGEDNENVNAANSIESSSGEKEEQTPSDQVFEHHFVYEDLGQSAFVNFTPTEENQDNSN